MKWRVVLELTGPDGSVRVHEVGGRATVAEYAPQTMGLTLAEGKRVLGALQVHLVQAQTGITVDAGDAASAAARSGPSKISAPGDWCRCSARWRSARRALPRVGVR